MSRIADIEIPFEVLAGVDPEGELYEEWIIEATVYEEEVCYRTATRDRVELTWDAFLERFKPSVEQLSSLDERAYDHAYDCDEPDYDDDGYDEYPEPEERFDFTNEDY